MKIEIFQLCRFIFLLFDNFVFHVTTFKCFRPGTFEIPLFFYSEIILLFNVVTELWYFETFQCMIFWYAMLPYFQYLIYLCPKFPNPLPKCCVCSNIWIDVFTFPWSGSMNFDKYLMMSFYWRLAQNAKISCVRFLLVRHMRICFASRVLS